MRNLIASLLVLLFCVSAFAQEQTLEGDKEERARALFTELRCVVCQNQSIDSSDADVAKDLRAIVREQIAAGKSNSQVRTFLVARYGEFILLKPAFSWHTAFLWLSPLILLIFGAWISIKAIKGHRSKNGAALSSDEEAQLNRILDSHD